MKKSILSLFVGSLLLAACSKEEKPMSANPSQTGGHFNMVLKDMPQVTLDENGAGEWHNYYMGLIYDQLSADVAEEGFGNMDETELDNSIRTILNENIGGDDATYHRNNAIAVSDYFDDNDGCITNLSDLRTAIAGTSLSQTFRTGFNTFMNNALNVTSTSGATTLANGFKTWCNSNLSSPEKEIGKGTADVFEASFAYWNDNIDDWNDLLTNGQGGDNSNAAKASIAGADAAGFCYGAHVGYTGGTVTLPGVGTFAGWLGGGLAGGFLGSSYAIVSNVWDYFFG
ncbi:MAG TPA: hypothetical protein VD905_19590 [Flavobacteriales bacterium]|nr:hypothetical protein [Flavobacteriales bacterium]